MTPLQPSSPHPPIASPAASPSLEGARRLVVLLAVGGIGGREDSGNVVPGARALLSDSGDVTRALMELQAAALATLQAAAEAVGSALGVRALEVLRFSELQSAAVELHGSRGVIRRLDRVWGGPMLAEMEAAPKPGRPLRYVSTAFAPAHWMLTRGTARLDGTNLEHYAGFRMQQGQELSLDAGAAVLLRRGPLDTLMEAVQRAGLSSSALAQEVSEQGLLTPAGTFALDPRQRQARIAGRAVRLTASEVLALQVLAQTPGQIVSRERLAAALGFRQRAMDRIVVQLRDKLGDGLITTVYGVGYLLETAPPPATPALTPG